MPPLWRRRLAAGDSALWDLRLKIIENFKSIDLQSLNSLYERTLGVVFKPLCRTPAVVRRPQNNSVMHCVLVHVLQSGQIGTFIGQLRVAVLKPNASTLDAVSMVAIVRSDGVQLPKERLQGSLDYQVIVI